MSDCALASFGETAITSMILLLIVGQDGSRVCNRQSFVSVRNRQNSRSVGVVSFKEPFVLRQEI